MESPLNNDNTEIDVSKITKRYKILVVGADKVGKSSIISYICEEVVNTQLPNTLGIDQRVKHFKEANTLLKFIEIGSSIDIKIHAVIYVVDAGDTWTLTKASELATYSTGKGNLNFLLLNKSDRHDCILSPNTNWVKEFIIRNKIQATFSATLTVPKSIDIFIKEVNRELCRYYKEHVDLYETINSMDESKLCLKYNIRRNKKKWSCCN